MKCPKCGHDVPSTRGRCLYCGASLGNQTAGDAKQASVPWGKTVVVEKDGKRGLGISINIGKRVHEELKDIPESLRRGMEELLSEGGKNHFAVEETVVSTLAASEPAVPFATKPIEQTLDVVAQMKKLLNGGQIEYQTYTTTVIGIMKDFIDSFPEDRKLNYVVNEIKDSPFAPFVDDQIHNDLIKYFVSRAAGSNKE